MHTHTEIHTQMHNYQQKIAWKIIVSRHILIPVASQDYVAYRDAPVENPDSADALFSDKLSRIFKRISAQPIFDPCCIYAI